MSTRAFITGVSGPELSAAEREFIRAERPWGFILFKRNIETPAQVAQLVHELREAVDEPDAPVLIDQEGGRVQRLARRTGRSIRREPCLARSMTSIPRWAWRRRG